MRVFLFALVGFGLISCTKKETTVPVETPPAAQAPLKNKCETLISGQNIGFPEAQIAQALTIQQAPLMICHMTFTGAGKVQEGLFYIENDQPQLIKSTEAHNLPECGTLSRNLKPEVINIKFAGSAHAVLAIEELETIKGCCGTAEKSQSQIYFYDLTTHKMSSGLKSSNFCVAETEKGCEARCKSRDRTPVDSGTEYKFDWARCTEADGCEQIPFSKIIRGQTLKPKEFVLKWDDGLNLKEAAY